MRSKTNFYYPAADHLQVDDNRRFARTEDGEFYARARLGICSAAKAWVIFDLYVQLSQADWNALREGTAKYVTGKIKEELPFQVIGEYVAFEPSESMFACEGEYMHRLDGAFSDLLQSELEAA
ncbi:MAG: hypothetical protein AAF682_00135 [Planctomycetota bacterium]